ncbi:MAG: endolytic transglycosylase MltG, partial [Ruminococcus sp.]|nr:endolytic transglycosylase MltG [Ruminococcus sp.]
KYYPYRSEDKLPADSAKNYKSRYDTYDKEGLPPGPICNPGMEAIKAALKPYDTSYYFFCHDKYGNAYYASTIYEHEANLENIDD